MKKIIVLFAFIAFLLPLQSFSTVPPDSDPAKHEFSVAYQLPTNNIIYLNYARRVSENNWLKFGLNLGATYSKNTPLVNTTYPTSSLDNNVGIRFGFENHKSLKSNFEFISGAFISVGSDIHFDRVDNPSLPIRLQRTTTFSFNYGLGATFGLFYKVSENFLIGSSINPSIIYSDYIYNSFRRSVVDMDLINISIIDLKYRF